ncbi:MAG: metallophosphatase family protein [Firmicutes bacterium]|nr:metallophosphatase family protein [Bacillota bacterium]
MELILSDIHANLHALGAVLRHASRRTISRYVLLGDFVDYGVHPNEVMEKIHALEPKIMVRGNHDRACSSLVPIHHFSPVARMACLWTRHQLISKHSSFLGNLPMGPQTVSAPSLVNEAFFISHGSPSNEDDYLADEWDAQRSFRSFSGHLCFFGHTHIPGAFELDTVHDSMRWVALPAGKWFVLKPHCRYLVNPGSVGQPRDRDPRASFLYFDSEQWRVKLQRVDYDYEGAAKAILEAGFPKHLAERLFMGV